MPFCPFCQNEVIENVKYCSRCGQQLNLIENDALTKQKRRGLFNHTKYSLSFIKNNPIILIPEFITVVVSWGIFRLLGESFLWFNFDDLFRDYLGINTSPFISVSYTNDISTLFWILPIVMMLVLITVTGISGLFTFLTFHMAWERTQGNNINFRDSVSYVKSRFGKFFLASIVASALALTIILLPAVLFMYTIMVVDYSGIRDGLSKGFKLSVDNIGTSVGLVFFYVIAIWLVGLVPIIGTFLRFLPTVVFELATLDLYLNSKHRLPISK
jgi:hypothetical protein